MGLPCFEAVQIDLESSSDQIDLCESSAFFIRSHLPSVLPVEQEPGGAAYGPTVLLSWSVRSPMRAQFYTQAVGPV